MRPEHVSSLFRDHRTTPRGRARNRPCLLLLWATRSLVYGCLFQRIHQRVKGEKAAGGRLIQDSAPWHKANLKHLLLIQGDGLLRKSKFDRKLLTESIRNPRERTQRCNGFCVRKGHTLTEADKNLKCYILPWGGSRILLTEGWGTPHPPLQCPKSTVC